MKSLAVRYGYRNDPDVPAFPDAAPLFIYDGQCIMCSGFVRWLVEQDAAGRIHVTPAQGEIGRGLYRHLGIAPDRFDTHLLLVDGHVLGRSDAAIGLLDLLGGGWRLLGLAGRIVPRPLRDAAYDWLARNRYRIRGQRDSCWRPDATFAARVL
jgi:predicted DCC family thiol-disulfide oxidoreductase YuxK